MTAGNLWTVCSYNLDKQLTQITRPDGQQVGFGWFDRPDQGADLLSADQGVDDSIPFGSTNFQHRSSEPLPVCLPIACTGLGAGSWRGWGRIRWFGLRVTPEASPLQCLYPDWLCCALRSSQRVLNYRLGCSVAACRRGRWDLKLQ